VLKYVPDFAMAANSHEVTSRSSEPNNPAILVDVKGPSVGTETQAAKVAGSMAKKRFEPRVAGEGNRTLAIISLDLE
jgi:hypothetical protein